MKPSESGDSVDTAILLADSFDHRFTPITLDIPRVCKYHYNLLKFGYSR